MMSSISEVLGADHRDCDALFASVAETAERGEWSNCRERVAAFSQSLKHHMKIEEQALFPAFEEATGIGGGPTRAMRHEHRQMLALLDAVAAAAAAHDAARFRAAARSFTTLMSSHGAKEETVLYPMCDELLRQMSGEQLWQMVPRP